MTQIYLFTGQLWPASNELCELGKQFIAGNNSKKLVEWQQFISTGKIATSLIAPDMISK